ncbi:MAG: hypothetical protein JST16_18885 [Bdellovibrionales bacterium]|nr:hypothetical protein [Bdellovibrionales bacterium]
MKLAFFTLTLASSFALGASPTNEKSSDKAPPKVRYKSAGTVNLDAQTVQGAVKRPEAAVVTGNRDEVFDGVLRLRENFLDHAAVTAGENVR